MLSSEASRLQWTQFSTDDILSDRNPWLNLACRPGPDYLRRDGFVADDEFFYAEQNARVVKNAERYSRTMFQGRVSSWNLRDEHMAETLAALLAHLGRRVRRPKVVLWEHNSHLGDARATQMPEAGEINVGQLARYPHRPRAA
jgi:erythromycin esterase-like protein